MFKNFLKTEKAVANSSNEVNANEHLENGTRLLTPKRQGGRGRFKSLPFGAFATVIFVAVASVLIFYGCKKDDPLDINKAMHKSLNSDELWEFEIYTPDENTLSDKLLMFTNYMNDASSVMPNMEIKEAICFMEAFFNFGVCAKQERGVEYINARETYNFIVPFTADADDATQILLNGETLQTVYRNTLITVKSEINDENAMNFGDLYVQDITFNASGTEGEVIFGLEVLYGPVRKGIGNFAFLALLHIGDPVVHPDANKENPFYRSYGMFDFGTKFEIRDEEMCKTLNQKEFYDFFCGIVDKNMRKRRGTSANSSPWGDYFLKTGQSLSAGWYFDANDYTNWGTQYIDYIWNNIAPQYSYGITPILGECVLKRGNAGGGLYDVWHDYGVEKVYIWAVPLSTISNLDRIMF